MVGHNKDAIEEKSLLYTLELLLHFAPYGVAFSTMRWRFRQMIR